MDPHPVYDRGMPDFKTEEPYYEFAARGKYHCSATSLPGTVRIMHFPSGQLWIEFRPDGHITIPQCDGHLETCDENAHFVLRWARAELVRQCPIIEMDGQPVVFGQNDGRAYFATERLHMYARETRVQSEPVDITAYFSPAQLLDPRWNGGAPSSLHLHKTHLTLEPTEHGFFAHKLTSDNVAVDELDDLVNNLERLATALTLASGILVSCPRLELLTRSTMAELLLRNVRQDLRTFDRGKLQIMAYGQQEKRVFIEHCVKMIADNEGKYPVTKLVLAFTAAKHAPNLESRLLLLANFLEILRYHHALNVMIPSGQITLRSDSFYFASNHRHATFADVLQDFCRTQCLEGWERDFVDLRNGIVHEGNLPTDESEKRFYRMHDFCFRCLMAILQGDAIDTHYVKRDDFYLPHPANSTLRGVRFTRSLSSSSGSAIWAPRMP